MGNRALCVLGGFRKAWACSQDGLDPCQVGARAGVRWYLARW